jgi:BON domain
VDTVLGRVTLHGKVGSTEEKTKAEAVAQKIDGVKSEHNLLQVVAPQHEKAMQVSDDALKQRVEVLAVPPRSTTPWFTDCTVIWLLLREGSACNAGRTGRRPPGDPSDRRRRAGKVGDVPEGPRGWRRPHLVLISKVFSCERHPLGI